MKRPRGLFGRWIERRARELSRRELRQSYAEAVIARQLAAAEGTAAAADPRDLGAVEAAAGLFGRALSTARPELPDGRPAASPALAAVSPAFLADVGRALIEAGEAVYDIEVELAGGLARVALIRASSHTIRGGPRPRSWMYDLTLAGPTNTLTPPPRPAAGVVHVRVNTDPGRPWVGRSPLDVASSTADGAAAADTSMRREFGGPLAQLIPVPRVDGDELDEDGDERDPLDGHRTAIADADGSAVLLETTRDSYGQGPAASAPARDWVSSRLGPNVPAANVEAYAELARHLVAACGVPPELLDARTPGPAMREAWRWFHDATLRPHAVAVAAELADKLDLPGLVLRLPPPDLLMRARGAGSLMGGEGGLDFDAAAAVVGLGGGG